MTDGALTRGQLLSRVLIVAPLITVAGTATLWLMGSVREVAGQLGWPWWVVALLIGLLLVGPLLVATTALGDRILRAAGSPPFMSRLVLGAPTATRDARKDD